MIIILNNERKTKKLLEIAKDPYSKQRVNGRLDISNVDLRVEDLNERTFCGVDFRWQPHSMNAVCLV